MPTHITLRYGCDGRQDTALHMRGMGIREASLHNLQCDMEAVRPRKGVVMPWVKVSDNFYDHPKFADLSALGIAAWVIGLAYCNRNLTDGRIPKPFAHRCVNTDGLGVLARGKQSTRQSMLPADSRHAVQELLDAGLWRDEGTCYAVHDYHDYQPSADDVRREQALRAERQARWRSKRGERNASRNASTDASRNGSQDASRNGSRDALATRLETVQPVARSPVGTTYQPEDHLRSVVVDGKLVKKAGPK